MLGLSERRRQRSRRGCQSGGSDEAAQQHTRPRADSGTVAGNVAGVEPDQHRNRICPQVFGCVASDSAARTGTALARSARGTGSGCRTAAACTGGDVIAAVASIGIDAAIVVEAQQCIGVVVAASLSLSRNHRCGIVAIAAGAVAAGGNSCTAAAAGAPRMMSPVQPAADSLDLRRSHSRVRSLGMALAGAMARC